MNFKKILAAATACTLTLGSLAGCTGKDETKTTKKVTTAEAIEEEEIIDGKGATLEVLTNRTDRVSVEAGGDGTLEKLTEAFEEAYNCKVEYTAYTNYNIDALKRMKTDDYGDVLCISTNIKKDELATYFVSLGTVDELDDTYRWASEKKGTDDNVYGLATAGSTVGILYNISIWKEAGITDLPTTPEEFIEDLKIIGEKTDAIPYYTNFAAADWTLTQFQNLVVSAAGGADSENDLLTSGEDIFAEGNGYYEVYKFMFDLLSTAEVLETDHVNTDWESSKVWFSEGKIASMVMGSWAYQQFVDVANDNGLDSSCVGYMPAPITAADGNIYAEISPDYFMGVSNKSENQELAIAFVKWFVGKSGYAQAEGMIPTKIGTDLPDNLSAFENAVFFEKTPAPAELDGKFDEIDKASGLGVWDSTKAGHFRMKIAEAAFSGASEDEFNAIIDECNKAWNEARKEVLGY